MKAGKSIFMLMLISLMATSFPAYSAELEFRQEFENAFLLKDYEKMSYIVVTNIKKIPDEIESILDEAFLPKKLEYEKKSLFLLAEAMGTTYNNMTDDIMPLLKANRRIFESVIPGPIRSKSLDGVHIVKTMSSDEVKNLFAPANIIIKKGETVRWINLDRIAHIVGSLYSLGESGLLSERFGPGESWEYTFTKAGEYYYICHIHNIMRGKITVEE